MSREIQPLFITLLKNISKQPTYYLNEGALKRAFASGQYNATLAKLNVDLVQLLADYVAEAGRLTDDILPPSLFNGKFDVCLKNSKISGKYLVKVVNCCSATLTKLDVSGCFQVDDNTLRAIVQTCKRLTHLNVKNCRKLTDVSLNCLVKEKPSLVALNIGGNFNLTISGIESFLMEYRSLDQLKEFNLSGLGVTDDVLLLISTRCNGLTSFGMGYCEISESGLLKFFSCMGSQLTKLNLSWHSSAHAVISISFLLECIANYCPKLVELDVSGLKNFNSAHLIQLIEQRLQQHMANPVEWHPFAVLHVKFISSPKAVIESTVCAAYPGITFNC